MYATPTDTIADYLRYLAAADQAPDTVTQRRSFVTRWAATVTDDDPILGSMLDWLTGHPHWSSQTRASPAHRSPAGSRLVRPSPRCPCPRHPTGSRPVRGATRGATRLPRNGTPGVQPGVREGDAMNGNTTTAHHTGEDLLAALDSPSLGSGAEWQPTKAGDTVIGKILRFEHPVTKAEGRILPIVILEVEGSDGPETLRVAVKHSILRDELLDRGAQIGDRVAIRFLGQPEGKRYFLYRVAVAANGPPGGDGSAGVHFGVGEYQLRSQTAHSNPLTKSGIRAVDPAHTSGYQWA